MVMRPGALLREANLVGEDDPIIGHVTALVDALRERGQSTLSLALGDPGERCLLVVAIDGKATRLREALTEYLDWTCALWNGSKL